ncbi:hypothetical protein Pla163_20060 [Planctomycetes bacterium Pla163]|uniref:N-acetyltransferase domain-containing protein n=1 Tax=Rohdeia mirabilis TaxID=2528008 RepID=A0A518D090_9BACT|nr:hypothetical protein Pla163_20060 [Planctomycetes bacterium Pla163]
MNASAYSIRACSSADREEQARLFNASFKKDLDAAELGWRYDQGPHGGSITLVTDELGADGTRVRAVSGYACNPRRVLHRGEEATTVGQTGDVMTHPDARGKGLFSDLDRACMRATAEAGWTAVFGLPNRKSAPLFVGKLGWNEIGRIRPHTFLFDGSARARRIRTREGRLRGLTAPFDARRCAAARRALARTGAGVQVHVEPSFPRVVGDISRSVERQFDWMVHRDAEYLDWRFAQNPSGLHRILIARRGTAVEGYAVVQRPLPDRPDTAFLVDMLAPDLVVRAALAAAAMDEAAAAGAVALEATAIDDSWWSSELAGYGFLPPKDENHLIVISYVHRDDEPVARAMLDARSWYLTDGDRDDATMG